MTSQLNVDTIVDKAGSGGTNVKIGNTSTYVSENSTTTQNTVQGIAKAWAVVDGTGTISLSDSFNCVSVVDEGTGDYDVFYTNNMASANYSTPMNPSGDSFLARSNEGRTTSKVHIQTINLSDVADDDGAVTMTAHGDLA